MASSVPAATVGLSLAALAVATAYGSGPILILTAIPMLIIANAYRRLNLWTANTGASFEWVGRAINPYLGFLTGWLTIAAYIIGTVAEVLLLGPSVLAVFGSSSTNTWAYVGIGCAVGLIMLVIAVVGIKITALAEPHRRANLQLVAYAELSAGGDRRLFRRDQDRGEPTPDRAQERGPADRTEAGDPPPLPCAPGVVRNWTIREWNEALVPGQDKH